MKNDGAVIVKWWQYPCLQQQITEIPRITLVIRFSFLAQPH